ncbi:hypothetical protein BDW72DRAFT_208845 [Aspergillus terricola var. indicus]
MSKVFSDFKSDSDSNTNLELNNKKQYADSTQEKLDNTCIYWNRYYQFFAWRCDICHGKNGQYFPGLRTKSLLEIFWKLWHLVLKQETASGLCKEIIYKVIALAAQEKELELTGRLKKNMYIKDIAMFACQHIQILFFCQLAAYTASRPGALLHLCYQDIGLKLIRDPEGGQPWLFIFLKPDFTKIFLGKKALNKFKILEIIFDPSLVLSPHVCLLSMLFHIQGFKRLSKTRPVLDSLEKLYSLWGLDGLGQQELLLKDKLSDKFVFCQKKLTATMLGSRFGKVTDTLQNVILQHADIYIFVRHYKVDINIDVQGIVRKTESQIPLLFRLSAEESKSLNILPVVLAWQEKLQHANIAASHCVEDCKPDLQLQKKLELLEDQTMEAKRRYNIAICELNKQPVIDIKQQLAGKLVNTKVINTLEHKSSMALQHLAVINALLTMPGTTLEAENDDTKIALRQAMEFVKVKDQREWPTTCFLYLGNPNLLLKE